MTKPDVGDWVSFERESRVVIACVLYKREAEYYPRPTLLITDQGTVDIRKVLEFRSQPVDARAGQEPGR